MHQTCAKAVGWDLKNLSLHGNFHMIKNVYKGELAEYIYAGFSVG
jgi:hypothetical protein